MILLYATFVLSFIAAILLDILFPVGYHAAAPIIPLIALSTMLYGVYMLFTVGLYIQRKTWYGVVFMTLAALVNVGLNIVLIPLYGSMGAAVSTLIAYVLLALIAYVVNQRIYPVPFEIGIFMTALLVGIVLYVGADLLAQRYGIYGASGIYSGFLAVYGGFLLLLARLASTYSQVQGDAIS
jgi:O-antigen/teichoic acid export membrane protein